MRAKQRRRKVESLAPSLLSIDPPRLTWQQLVDDIHRKWVFYGCIECKNRAAWKAEADLKWPLLRGLHVEPYALRADQGRARGELGPHPGDPRPHSHDTPLS